MRVVVLSAFVACLGLGMLVGPVRSVRHGADQHEAELRAVLRD